MRYNYIILNLKNKRNVMKEYGAIVIGTGAGGMPAAYRFAGAV